jgi:GT2 family glycosyltransferase
MRFESDEMNAAIIIVSFNCREELRQCLRSVPATRVVVVDNASTDGSAEMAHIANKTNRGFAAACNQGIAATTEPFVLLLNPDTVNPPLQQLLDCMETNPEAGACGPRILNPDGSPQISCRRFPTWWRMALAELGLRNFYYVRHPGREVEQLMGSCLLLRRAALEEVGLLDERFFLYFEEVDLCWRLKNAGWKILFVDDATITHTGGASSRPVRAEALRHRYESLFTFYRKHYPAWHLAVLKCAAQLGAFRRQGDCASIAREVWSM